MESEDLTRILTRVPSTNEGKARRAVLLTRWGIAENQPWSQRTLKSRRYYLGNQWDELVTAKSRRRLKLTDNQIRDDVDKPTARLLEADPVMEAVGRGTEDFELGQTWRDLVEYADEWTGSMHDSAKAIRRRCWTDMAISGDCAEWVEWDESEEGGLGFLVSEYVDGLNLVWDDGATSTQLRDARWLVRFEPQDVEILEAKYPLWRGRLKHDAPELFLHSGISQAVDLDYAASRSLTQAGTWPVDRLRQRAYEIQLWEKRPAKRKRFLLDGIVGKTRDVDGKVVEIDEARFEKMNRKQQQLYEPIDVDDYELWKTVVINEMVVEEGLSQYDAKNGGHGQYPLARYALTQGPNQTHALGLVEKLMAYQDMLNMTMSYGMERLFIDSSSLLAIQRGGQPRSEEAKLDRIGEVASQKFYYYPGAQLPQAIALGSPGAAQMFQATHDWLSQRKDKVSQVTDVHRASPQYGLSGRAIQSLLSEADLATTQMRLSVEDGLRQATILRISLMQQFLRSDRMVRISSKAERAGYALYVTTNEKRLAQSRQLAKPKDVPGADFYQTPDGGQARVMELSDEGIRKFDLRLRLDTGKQRNRDQRMDLVTQVLGYIGPGAGVETLLWALELLEAPNLDKLGEALKSEDAKTQIMQQVDQAQKETGMSLPEMIAAAVQMAALLKAKGNGTAPRGPAGPAGPAGPGGMLAAGPAPMAAPTTEPVVAA